MKHSDTHTGRHDAPRDSNLSKRVKQYLLERDGANCHYCGKLTTKSAGGFNPDGSSIDHIIPVINGGTDDLDNLILACRQCNMEKRTLSYHEFQLAKQTDLMLIFLMGGAT